MTLSKIKRLTCLLFIAGGVVTGQTLEDIAIVDSETSYFLTLTFDEVPKYRTSEVYEPPSFTITFTGADWGKGDFARRVMTDPLYQYSIRIVTTSFGREDLELRLDFFSNTEIKINKSGDRKIIVSWEKFKDQVEVQPDTSFLEIKEMTALDALQQTVSLRFRDATIQDVVRLLFVSYGLNMILHPSLTVGEDEHITLLLKDVTIEVALSLILKMNGYDWYLDNEIIIVKPFDLTLQGELITKVYDLKFADGEMIASALGNGVLSTKGTSVAFTTGIAGSFNDKLMVTDIEANLPAVEKLINSLDQKTQQIHISVKFIETTLSADEHLGINWGLRADLVGPTLPDTSGLFVNIGHWNELSMAQLTLPVFTSILQLLTTDNETRLLQEPAYPFLYLKLKEVSLV